MAYFFVAISTRQNLELCKKHALAGFPQTWSGLWAYVDIQLGDFISFLYGGRAYGLYKVTKKKAFKDATSLPPQWEPVLTRKGPVYFPFRLFLEPVRELNESLARLEFLYIAENLLRRGGIRKSHFQADQTTLCNVSRLGSLSYKKPEVLNFENHETFTPLFVGNKKNANPPEVNLLREEFLHVLLRHYLSKAETLKSLLEEINIYDVAPENLEVLGERALERGYVDLLIKEKEPLGTAKQIVVEVKTKTVSKRDVEQLLRYKGEIGEECIAGLVIANKVSKRIQQKFGEKVHFWKYEFKNLDLNMPQEFDKLLSAFSLSAMSNRKS